MVEVPLVEVPVDEVPVDAAPLEELAPAEEPETLEWTDEEAPAGQCCVSPGAGCGSAGSRGLSGVTGFASCRSA